MLRQSDWFVMCGTTNERIRFLFFFSRAVHWYHSSGSELSTTEHSGLMTTCAIARHKLHLGRWHTYCVLWLGLRIEPSSVKSELSKCGCFLRQVALHRPIIPLCVTTASHSNTFSIKKRESDFHFEKMPFVGPMSTMC